MPTDPQCVPDPDDSEEDEYVVYNVVANPVLEFTDNFFESFTGDEVLSFPGANNVPLGALDIRGNKVSGLMRVLEDSSHITYEIFQVHCNCESLKELAALVDYEHVVPRDHAVERGALLFRKEFYDTGLCVDPSGNEVGLKAYLRERIVVSQPGEKEESLQVDAAAALNSTVEENDPRVLFKREVEVEEMQGDDEYVNEEEMERDEDWRDWIRCVEP